MAQNLNFETSYSYCYDDDPENCATYGRLYTWGAAVKACPPGWRMPDMREWYSVVSFYGSEEAAYQALIEGGTTGFNALLAGTRNTDGSFLYLGAFGFYWLAARQEAGFAYNYSFNSGSRNVDLFSLAQGVGLSVRCIQA